MKRIIASLIIACLVFAMPSAALAAQGDPAPMDVQVWPGAEPGQLLVIVSVFLPADTKLPATVRIPVIDGLRLLWAGEIGTSQQGDVQRQPQVKKGEGGSFAEFQVTSSKQAQIELGSVPLSQTADGFSATVDFVQSVPTTSTSFSVRLPSQAADAKISPTPVGTPGRNNSGETLYTLPSKQLKTGDKQQITVGYRVASAPTSTSGTAGSANKLIGVLLALIAVAVVVLIVVLNRQRQVAAESDEEYAEDDYAEDEE